MHNITQVLKELFGYRRALRQIVRKKDMITLEDASNYAYEKLKLDTNIGDDACSELRNADAKYYTAIITQLKKDVLLTGRAQGFIMGLAFWLAFTLFICSLLK